MKRLFSALLVLLLLGALALPCLAGESESVRTDTALSSQEIAYLNTLFQTVKKAYGIEAFFYMNYDYGGSGEIKPHARAFLEERATGEDALVFAVSAESYYMNTRGKAGELLTDDDLDPLYDAIRDADSAGEQYKAAVQFYTALNTLLSGRAGIAAETPSEPEQAEATTERVILPGSVPIPDEISPTRGDRLVDQADLLTPEAEAALQEKLDRMSEEMQFDVVIVTAMHIGTRTPMEFADDYFDYNGFGYGEDYDGVALLISMAERDWWISTSGFGLTALSDDYFMNFIDPSDFTYHLKRGEYDKSFNAFADLVKRFVVEAKENEPYSAKHRIHVWSYIRIGLIFSVIVGLISAAIAVYYKYDNYVASVHTKSEANDYLVSGVELSAQSDTFLYKRLIRDKRVEQASSSDSSGGSSHHTPGAHVSSSGRTHGGGGGKF